MRGKYLHKLGVFILAATMLFGVVSLAGDTAQAQRRNGVVVVPRVDINRGRGRHHHHRRWRRHRRHRG
jgi:hypothetical protein